MKVRKRVSGGVGVCILAGLLLAGCGIDNGPNPVQTSGAIDLNTVNGKASSPIFSSGADAKTLDSTDIGWVDKIDANNARYYLADRGATIQTNPGGLGRVWAIDTVADTVVTSISGFTGRLALPVPNPPLAIPGYTYAATPIVVGGVTVGTTAVTAPGILSNISGPNGVTVANDNVRAGNTGAKELWAGDGDGSAKVSDLTAASPKVTKTIPTGGFNRSDELAYDPDHDLILIANDADTPVFVTLINRGTKKIIGQITFDTKSAAAAPANQTDVSFCIATTGTIAAAKYGHGPNATGGIEQPVYVHATGLFYIAVPATTENPNGEIDAIDPVAMKVTARYPTATAGNAFCTPHGLSVNTSAPGMGTGTQAAIACGDKVNMGLKVIDLATGTVVADIAQGGGSDMAWYNPPENRYYIGCGNYSTNGGTSTTPLITVINAATNTWVKNVVTGSIKDGKSVAVSPINNKVYSPIAEVGGIKVFYPMLFLP